MTADTDTTPNERAISGAMALVTHALFFALLVFGVTWQKRQPEAIVVDLWNNLPPITAPKAEPVPEVKPEPPAPKPEPAPRVEAKAVPKAEPKPVPKAETRPEIKPDIALQEKQKKERKAAEQALAEKKKREQEQAQIAALREHQAKEAKEAESKQRAAREQEEALKKVAAQQAAAAQSSRIVDEYKRRIAEKIRRFIVEPPNLQGNPEVEMDVVLLPGGEVLGVKTRKGSTMTAWDNAVERAILKAQPLPLPPDPALFKDFRELNLKIRPKD